MECIYVMPFSSCAGGDNATPPCRLVEDVLRSLLTPYLVKMMQRAGPPEVLKLLNSNTENPYLIWDNRTRAELTKYLEDQQKAIIRTVRVM